MSNRYYYWPSDKISTMKHWRISEKNKSFFEREMPEGEDEVAVDSRWPAFYPSPINLVTVSDGSREAMEPSVGASIVNRFPYVCAISLCRKHLSARHYVRNVFSEMIEKGGSVAVQFFSPGTSFTKAIEAIRALPEDRTCERISYSGLSTRIGISNDAPVFHNAYMVYECSLVKKGRDFEGLPIFDKPWIDVGSHRVYFLEINAIQLAEDIALGHRQIYWQSLPAWKPVLQSYFMSSSSYGIQQRGYVKGYTPRYRFPSSSTTTFESDARDNGMAIKHLPPLPENQVEVDNDKARWPCFFPSSLSLVTAWAEKGIPNVMPCGSTMVVSRQPMTFAICIAYAKINDRYKTRAMLDIIRKTGYFGCGVPFINKKIVDAIQYFGNVSYIEDQDKVLNAGLNWESGENVPILQALPVQFECSVVDEIRLGTHSMFLGQVRRILVRADVTPDNPLKWSPLASIRKRA